MIRAPSPARNSRCAGSFKSDELPGEPMAQLASLAPTPDDFHRPPLTKNAEGRLRTVGVEVEYAGLTAEASARLLAEAFGGSVIEEDAHSFTIRGSSLGDVSIALDSQYLHPGKYEPLLGAAGVTLASWIGSAASYIVPCELVT